MDDKINCFYNNSVYNIIDKIEKHISRIYSRDCTFNMYSKELDEYLFEYIDTNIRKLIIDFIRTSIKIDDIISDCINNILYDPKFVNILLITNFDNNGFLNTIGSILDTLKYKQFEFDAELSASLMVNRLYNKLTSTLYSPTDKFNLENKNLINNETLYFQFIIEIFLDLYKRAMIIIFNKYKNNFAIE